MIDDKFIILAVLITLAGNINYIYHTIQGQTKPNRVTWFLWTLIPMITFSAMLSEGAETTALILTFASGFMPLMTFCASFFDKKAFWKINKFDYVCGTFSLVGIAAWIITQEGYLAIVFAIIADFLATLPTIIKSYKYPETESWPNFLGGSIYALIALLTFDEWTFATVAWPINVMAVCTVLFVLIRFRIGPRIASSRL